MRSQAQKQESEHIGVEQLLEAGGGLERAVRILQLLGHPVRLRILCELLNAEELAVGELLERVQMSQSALSQHLAKLRAETVVETRRDQQRIYYRTANEEVRRILECLHGLYCRSGH